MAAYIIFTRESTRNSSELESYAPKARASMKGHAGTVRVAYGRQEMLEGAPVEGVVVVEFPTFEEAKAWYDSPAYREAREYRFRGADYRAVIVQGV